MWFQTLVVCASQHGVSVLIYPYITWISPAPLGVVLRGSRFDTISLENNFENTSAVSSVIWTAHGIFSKLFYGVVVDSFSLCQKIVISHSRSPWKRYASLLKTWANWKTLLLENRTHTYKRLVGMWWILKTCRKNFESNIIIRSSPGTGLTDPRNIFRLPHRSQQFHQPRRIIARLNSLEALLNPSMGMCLGG